ncbi:MAG: ABC transporter ATP-binding protein [Elusimicrobia bacterium]|nr:ABC transporter ATP-binding protein [Elusimicrobiota bacterium]
MDHPVNAGPLLTASGLSKTFEDFQALSAVSFEVREGEILGLIGPNGAGKTTLIECLTGLLETDAGSVERDERPLPGPRRKETMFYLPDGISPYPERSVLEVLRLFQALHGQEDARLRRVIDRLEISGALNTRMGHLSKGTLKRCLLALGLLAPQPLLILDEPFDGLDLRQTRAVMDLLRETRAQGKTLLLSIHQLTDAQRICDRLLLLCAGRLVGEGSMEDLRRLAGSPNASLEDIFLALT